MLFSMKQFSSCLFISLSTFFFYELFFLRARARDARAERDSRRKHSSLAREYPMRRINTLLLFLCYRNTFYQNIEAEICEIRSIF